MGTQRQRIKDCRTRNLRKMAPKIKLTYFNLRGRAEPVRLLLAYGGLEYEDCRLVPGFEDPKPWMALKPKTPYGGLPLLEWNGETIAQSLTITRLWPERLVSPVATVLNVPKRMRLWMPSMIYLRPEQGIFSKDDALMKKYAT